MRIEVDNQSGFCFGVVNAIAQAEKELEERGQLYCLGQIVHNNEEEQRLTRLGLQTISHAQLPDMEGEKVMIRAHGEPPETYRTAYSAGVKFVDASCPVVLKLQAKVRRGYEAMESAGGQVVIFGKRGHAEVIALRGQTDGAAYVVEKIEDVEVIDPTKPVELFAQTTMNPIDYEAIAQEIRRRMEEAAFPPSIHLKVHKTICGQVMNRKQELADFAHRFDCVVFVSGRTSSNGRMLFEVCRSENQNSHFISSADELRAEWFDDIQSVGVCGATSTPRWLMESLADKIREITR